MPHFQREHSGQHKGLWRSATSMPRLGSVETRTVPGPDAATRRVASTSDAASIVRSADNILAAERPRGGDGGQLHKPIQATTTSASGSDGDVRRLARAPVGELKRSRASMNIEPAPIVSATGPIAPGGVAEAILSLVNDDAHPAHIEFYATDLVGEGGMRIPAANLMFEPRAMVLEDGLGADTKIQILVPAHATAGMYSGLIRASKLDYLHAVLIVQVE